MYIRYIGTKRIIKEQLKKFCHVRISFLHVHAETTKEEILAIASRHSAMMRPNNFATSSFESQYSYEKKWLIKIPLSFLFKSNCFLLTSVLAHVKLPRPTVYELRNREITYNVCPSVDIIVTRPHKILF